MKVNEKNKKIEKIRGMMKEYGITLNDLKENDIVGFDAKISLVSGVRGYEEAFHNMVSYRKDAEQVKTEIQKTKFKGESLTSRLTLMGLQGKIVLHNWSVVVDNPNYIKLKALDYMGNTEYLVIRR